MRKLMVGVFLLALTAPAFAQPEKDYHGHAYIFVAPGGATGGGSTTGMLHLGGGGEGLFYKGLGVGGELGYLAPTRSFKDGVGVFSVNGAYHFVNSEKPRKLVPFVTVGYSLFLDRKSTRLNSSHIQKSRMPSSA